MENKSLSKKLEEIIGIANPPVAVRIIKTEEPLPNIKVLTQRSRYCQLLMLAKKVKL